MAERTRPVVKELMHCGVCEQRVRENDPCLVAFVMTRDGPASLPVHLACHATLIAGEVAREVVGVLRDHEEPGGLKYERGKGLKGTLRLVVERIVDELFDDDGEDDE